MTIQEFKNAAKIIEHNSLNDWGFGGWVGKIYVYNNWYMREGRWGTRHNGFSPYNQYSNTSNPVKYIQFTKEEFINELNNIVL